MKELELKMLCKFVYAMDLLLVSIQVNKRVEYIVQQITSKSKVKA